MPAPRSFCHRKARQQVLSSFEEPTTMILTVPLNGWYPTPPSAGGASVLADGVSPAVSVVAASGVGEGVVPAAASEPGAPAGAAPAVPVVPAVGVAPGAPAPSDVPLA